MATPDLTALDEERLGAWLLGRRWFGSKAEDVSQTHVLDVVTLDDGPPAVAIAAVEARFPTGTHAIYQLLLGMRVDGDGWSADRLDDLDGQTVYDAFADPEAAAVIPRLFAEGATIQGANATVDFGWGEAFDRPRPDATVRRDGRRAVQQLGRARRHARPQALPPARGGREPRARDAALPDRPRLPEHRRARRLDRLLGRAHGGDARRRPALRRGRPRRLGARARGDRDRPGGVRRADGPARRGDRRDAHGAGLRRVGPGVRARGAQPGVDVADHGDDRRADRAPVRRPAVGQPGARADRQPRRGGARPPVAPLARRQRRAAHPPPWRPAPRPDAARGRAGIEMDHPRLRGRARTAAARAPAQALAAARRGRDAALVRLRGVGRRDPARARRRPRAGRTARATPSSPGTSAPWTARSCRPASPTRAPC